MNSPRQQSTTTPAVSRALASHKNKAPLVCSKRALNYLCEGFFVICCCVRKIGAAILSAFLCLKNVIMPTLVNRGPMRSLPPADSDMDLDKSTGEDVEKHPGIHIGHISVYHNGCMIVLSGFRGYKDNLATYYRPSNEIWIYDPIGETWTKKLCTGETSNDDIPLERSGASGTVVNDHIYMFGGYSEEGNLNTLYRLNLNNLKWRHITPTGNPPLPCDKNVCWEFEEKLYLFAGYGRGPDPAQWRENIGYQFILDNTSHWHYLRGWNNQFVCYDPVANAWKWPKCNGNVPIARAAHAAAKIGNNVYVFGGRNGRTRMNDMYMLNMKNFEWTQIMPNDVNHPVKGRSWHSLTPISENHLALYGGFSMDNQPLSDCWIFDARYNTWKEIELPINKPRLWHTACLSSFGEILICGGAKKNIVLTTCRHHSKETIFAKDMFAVQFQPKSMFRLCLGKVASNETQLRRYWSQLPRDLETILYKRCIAAITNEKVQTHESDSE